MTKLRGSSKLGRQERNTGQEVGTSWQRNSMTISGDTATDVVITHIRHKSARFIRTRRQSWQYVVGVDRDYMMTVSPKDQICRQTTKLVDKSTNSLTVRWRIIASIKNSVGMLPFMPCMPNQVDCPHSPTSQTGLRRESSLMTTTRGREVPLLASKWSVADQ